MGYVIRGYKMTKLVRDVYIMLVGTQIGTDHNGRFWYMWPNSEEQFTEFYEEDRFIKRYYNG
jgi:hypothetical protein